MSSCSTGMAWLKPAPTEFAPPVGAVCNRALTRFVLPVGAVCNRALTGFVLPVGAV